MAASKVSLKLLIDRKERRVLFAEASKDFVDFLFTLLTLPIGTVIKLLDNRGMVGCLGKVYQSVSDLSDDYMQSNQQKDLVLKPKSSLSTISSQMPLLPPQECCSSPLVPKSFYSCGRCTGTNYLLSTTSNRTCPCCSYAMSNVVTHHVPKTTSEPAPAKVGEGGFVKGVVTYMVMDDLVIAPMSTISSITMLNKFNVKEVGALQEKVVHIGMDEGLELLKQALGSKRVLTNVFLGTQVGSPQKVSSVVRAWWLCNCKPMSFGFPFCLFRKT